MTSVAATNNAAIIATAATVSGMVLSWLLGRWRDRSTRRLRRVSPDAQALYRFLGEGRPRAIKANVIALPRTEGGLGLHRRYQQELIDELAEAGLFVCSSCGHPAGYYIPTTPAEVAPFVTQLDHRLMALGRKREAILRRYPELRPQVVRPPRRVIRPTGKVQTMAMDLT